MLHLAFLVFTSAMNFNWTPNTFECQASYDHCLRNAGKDCGDKVDECNKKAYEGRTVGLHSEPENTKVENNPPASPTDPVDHP